MKNRILNALLLFPISALFLHGQIASGKDPGFKLTLSRGVYDAESTVPMQPLNVTYTNTSNEFSYENMCGAFGSLYHLAVIYNGVPVKEGEDNKKRRVIAQSGTCRSFSGPARNLKPGQSRENILYYETAHPGTYEFSVDVDTDPLHPENNVTVKSNTITIVVPEPASSKSN